MKIEPAGRLRFGDLHDGFRRCDCGDISGEDEAHVCPLAATEETQPATLKAPDTLGRLGVGSSAHDSSARSGIAARAATEKPQPLPRHSDRVYIPNVHDDRGDMPLR